ncbi:hypothetical protein K5X82_15355 [Halosquirtibacter xylanolyticus]|uniref:hypothetical protein n=1 Tax=Halosquirtibacter xylanolyticus TaxID=3374599 RepID=UPI00374989B8|nr:hypothetical protein K5X82_15355 [Prolixibacteraceae bacterium]
MEKILIYLLILGVIFRVAVVKYGVFLEGFGLGALGVFYVIWSFIHFRDHHFRKGEIQNCLYDPITKKMSIIAGVGLFLTCIGTAEHLLFVTSSNIAVVIGLVILLGVMASEIVMHYREKRKYFSRVFKRVFCWILFGSFAWYSSGIRSVEIIYRRHPRFVRAYKAVKRNPKDQQLIELMKREYHIATGGSNDVNL